MFVGPNTDVLMPQNAIEQIEKTLKYVDLIDTNFINICDIIESSNIKCEFTDSIDVYLTKISEELESFFKIQV